MKTKNSNTSETVHYILTFICFIVAVGCFATNLFTGKPAIIRFDSLAGHILIGVIFFVYSAWFVYEDMKEKDLPLSKAITVNLKTNATLIFIAIFWLILIIFPFVCNIL